MLKFRKNSPQDSTIGIVMRDKESLFSPALRTGFIVAISFHLLFICLFSIVPFTLPFDSYIFPPIAVEAPNYQEGTAIATLEQNSEIPTGLAARPDLVLTGTTPDVSVPRMQSLNANESVLFTSIEQTFDLHALEFGPFKEKDYPEVVFIVSGELKMRYIQKNLPEITPTRSIPILFSIIVDDRTGLVIWYESISIIQDHELNRYAQDVLKQVKFTPLEHSFVTDGIVEFHFHSLMES